MRAGEISMPLFYFILKTGGEKIPDREGFEFPNQDIARAHAEAVAHELMRNREMKTRRWRLEVCDDDLQPCFEVLFAATDPLIAHLPASYRESVEGLSSSTANLHDTFAQVRTTLSSVRETLARADELMSQLRRRQWSMGGS
jgi:hypothetical protein